MSELKKFADSLEGKPVLVYGLGRSGTATARALSKAGVNVVIGDDFEAGYESLEKCDVTRLDAASYDMRDYACLVLAPGIPLTHPEPHDIVVKAQEAGVEIICDIELFSRIYPQYRYVGITGTNGKSTTTALVHHILKEAGVDALLGGNIGTPVFDLKLKSNVAYAIVLEMSSFQLDLCPKFRPDISAILNISSDHLDRHGSLENYVKVKETICNVSEGVSQCAAIIVTDDPQTREIFARQKEVDADRDVIEVNTEKTLKTGVFADDKMLCSAHEGAVAVIGDVEKLKHLRGAHNYQNIACAYAITKRFDLPDEKIWLAMESFPGLHHRQHLLRSINGVSYVNDSKATNAAAAAMALGTFRNIYWIVGGRKKKNGLEGVETFFSHIKHAFLIGEAMEDFASWLDKYGIEYTRSYELERAVEGAHKMAQDNRGQPGGAGTVLLSPACASFDQYKSFEDRGDHFTRLVQELEEEA